MKNTIILLANSQRYFIHLLRVAVFIAWTWMALIELHSCHAGCNNSLAAYVLPSLFVIAGTLNLLGIWLHKTGLIGGLLTSLISLVTLVILVLPGSCGVSVLAMNYLLLIPAGLICVSDCAKQIFRAYVMRGGKA